MKIGKQVAGPPPCAAATITSRARYGARDTIARWPRDGHPHVARWTHDWSEMAGRMHDAGRSRDARWSRITAKSLAACFAQRLDDGRPLIAIRPHVFACWPTICSAGRTASRTPQAAAGRRPLRNDARAGRVLAVRWPRACRGGVRPCGARKIRGGDRRPAAAPAMS
ncbi:hypothetical protein F511_44356 [Dorcoceras hygrometricum]|uniref:Uncharacterized protein n=1 Tax=Dorcoceras hygrometricum TaxID=472368 RepID=A0A2Z7AZ77_9LAMI|nr:hypothetical protein F511_44356 [Dorcoceras hygrometricum]